MPADPAPIRGRWTLPMGGSDCPECGLHFPMQSCKCAVGHDVAWCRPRSVKVVPVPDKAAIERGAKAREERDGAGIGWHAATGTYAVHFPNDEVVPGYESPEAAARDVDRLVALAVLRAALEGQDA